MHNILQRHHVAYLADEVGMGKTYVALGVVALLRHFTPDLRVLVIAPRQNIQQKWQREQGVFIKNNVRLDDLRVRMPGGLPARLLVHCRDLIQLLEETAVGPDRDFFVRLPSFSLPHATGRAAATQLARPAA
ncbi:DEAD/DEAH box helicase family protein [Micromonospora sp. BRA006-A]|nr:DEAD/DEAH box helicase family protein [Micromonospora sp. BRA006-A]